MGVLIMLFDYLKADIAEMIDLAQKNASYDAALAARTNAGSPITPGDDAVAERRSRGDRLADLRINGASKPEENMEATVWAGTGKKQFGIRVGASNRARYFSSSWSRIVVEMDGQLQHVELSPGFWTGCPEFRDGRDGHIKSWLGKHGLLEWPKGHPPRVVLEPLGGSLFRLLKR
jgi:hypothetical protein